MIVLLVMKLNEMIFSRQCEIKKILIFKKYQIKARKINQLTFIYKQWVSIYLMVTIYRIICVCGYWFPLVAFQFIILCITWKFYSNYIHYRFCFVFYRRSRTDEVSKQELRPQSSSTSEGDARSFIKLKSVNNHH